MTETTEELIGRLLNSAALLSREQANRLQAEVREQVESEVRQILHAAWKAALLREVAHQLDENEERHDARQCREAEPPPEVTRPVSQSRSTMPDEEDEEIGLYAYGIVTAAHPDLPGDLVAVDPAFPVEMLPYEGLQAIVSRVPLREFRPDRWAERIANVEDVEAQLRAHDGVLTAALDQGPLIPLRFGTIFSRTNDLLRVLSEKRDELRESLGRLDGKAEWGVKISRQGGARTDSPSSRPERLSEASLHNGSGRSYLLEKQRQRQEATETRQERSLVVRECHERLSVLACEEVVLPIDPRRRQRDGEKEILLNASYLLDRAQFRAFRDLVEMLAEQHEEGGLDFEITGPWPAYNFVNLELQV